MKSSVAKLASLPGKFLRSARREGLNASLKKSIWYAERYIRPGYCPRPPHRLTIATTHKCNLRCPLCITQNPPRPRTEHPCMEDALFRKIVEECFPHVEIVHLTENGEPLMAGNLEATIEAAERYNVKLDITTNGTLWDDEALVKRLIPVLNGAHFSIDAPTKKTFESIRVGADFGQVIDNMKLYNRLRRAHRGEHLPRFTICAVLMRRNIEELPELVELAKELGAESLATQHVKIYQEKHREESLLFHKELANERLGAARARAKELDFRVSLPPLYRFVAGGEGAASEPHPGERAASCAYLWREFMILIDGNVFPCCNSHPRKPIMGNVAETNFLGIWNNRIYRGMRVGLMRGNPYECCKHCSFLLGQPYPDDEEAHLQYALE